MSCVYQAEGGSLGPQLPHSLRQRERCKDLNNEPGMSGHLCLPLSDPTGHGRNIRTQSGKQTAGGVGEEAQARVNPGVARVHVVCDPLLGGYHLRCLFFLKQISQQWDNGPFKGSLTFLIFDQVQDQPDCYLAQRWVACWERQCRSILEPFQVKVGHIKFPWGSLHTTSSKPKSTAAHNLPGRGKWEGATHPNKKETGKAAVANSNPALVLTLYLSGCFKDAYLHLYCKNTLSIVIHLNFPIILN